MKDRAEIEAAFQRFLATNFPFMDQHGSTWSADEVRRFLLEAYLTGRNDQLRDVGAA